MQKNLFFISMLKHLNCRIMLLLLSKFVFRSCFLIRMRWVRVGVRERENEHAFAWRWIAN